MAAIPLNSHISVNLGKAYGHIYDDNIYFSTKSTRTVEQISNVLLTHLEKIPLHLFVIIDVTQTPKILLLDESQSRDLQQRLIESTSSDESVQPSERIPLKTAN